MQAIILHAPGDARLEDVPLPEPRPGELLVRVGAALTCGTDAKAYRRGHPILFPHLPSPFGHEFAGTIEAVGEGVPDLAVGQRIVAANSAPCGHCDECLRRRESLCQALIFLNGAYAEYILVPAPIAARNTYPIADSLTFAEAALVEPLACVLHGIDALDLSLGDTVAVIGAGPIGLFFVEALTRSGMRVIALDHNESRLVAAQHFGAAHTVLVADTADPIAAVRACTLSNRGAEVVIEAVGQPTTWELALGMVRRGGQVLLFGGPPSGTRMSLDTRLAHYSELTLRGVFHHTPAHVRRALDFITSGTIRARDYITGNRPLAETVAALTATGPQRGIKTAIIPSGADPAPLGALAGAQ